MSKIVCFGEIMLRLNPEGYSRIIQSDRFFASYAGSEANVAVSLANFGMDSSYITKLPKNELGQAALNTVRQYGVITDHIVRGGNRLGIYFLEKGASQRASKVIYDRKYSSIAEANSEEFDWKEIFKDAQWFHFSGITPALSDNAVNCCIDACKTAKEMGLTISCDLNYRKNLWSKEKANEVLSVLMQYVDVCVANEEDAYDVFGISAENTDVGKGIVSHSSYETVARSLADRFGCREVAITLRTSISANDNEWAGALLSRGEFLLIENLPHSYRGPSGGRGCFCSRLNIFLAGWQGCTDDNRICCCSLVFKT
jgi:2-dehydro-3-deoxygluconokinase